MVLLSIVRREPHDDDDPGVADETDFSASQVQSGALEDWVNGKLEDTLPADVATAAAAYSLRKVKAGYSGDAVRIRRSSNDTEVDVAFDSDDKVSTSSSITNVGSGDVDDTAETTLGNFLQGEADVRALFNNASYNPTASTSSNNYWRANPEIDLGTGAFTWSCDFIFTDSFGVNTSRIMQTFDSSSYWYWESSTRLRYQIGGSASGTTYLSSSTTIQLGRKYNMEFSRDASDNTTLKIDGVLVGTNTITARNTGQVDVGRLAGFRLAGAAFNFNFNNGQHIYAGDGVETSNWVDTGTGGIDLSKEGSPVLFTGQGMDSFVDIWYDQTGSNNATQATAANQPKIAESGALLADGIKFNGSTTSLATGSQVFTANETGSQSLYAVCNVTDGASGYIAGSADDNDSDERGQSIYYYTATDVFALSNGSTATNTTIDTISAIRGSNVLVSFNYNNNTANTLNQNANQNGYSDGSSAYDFEAGSNFIIGARGGTVQAGRAVNGSIQEVIAYTSDQSDNRFKIESNINNYYGLYNDANEFSANPTSAQSSVTLSNISKTGFTATIDATSETKQVAFPFVNDLVSGDDYFVSFNYTTSDSSKTVSVKPFQSAGGSNASNDTISATNTGFYGGTGDASHNGFDVNATATVLIFQTTGTSFNFTVSNFKISRIARNGFVETLYDQSGNGNDVDQGTAGSQPAIVQNGGQVKVGNRASIKFDGSNDFLERATYTQGELAQINTIFSVAKLDTYADENQKSI
jgi:hypothetical protein